MHYRHITDYCFGPNGVDASDVERFVQKLELPLKALASGQNTAATPLLALASKIDDLSEIEILAAQLRVKFKTVVVAGSGGSSLSGRALLQLKLMAGAPHFHFLENIDPDGMEHVLSHIDAKDTCFLIISKSGTTVETLAQYYVLRDYVEKRLGKKAVTERFILITVPGDNPLRRSALEYNLRVLDHDPHIGGRYAILSIVGLLPAAIAGLDIRALRRGAATVVADMKAPAYGAALQYAFMQKKIPMTVMLPYSEKLSGFTAWYRQNWSESLGKSGSGTTPVPSLGTNDQHSQLQLYLGGPKDKFFTLILLDRAKKGAAIPVPADPSLDYIRGKTLGDVMAAEQKATMESMVRHGCPLRVFAFEEMHEEQLGALLMHFTLEIILTASLMNVNPFDQPAVEEGKQLARDYLLSGKL